jgi:ubiquinone/menaquinone biosynthesis C-methylase UbiE
MKKIINQTLNWKEQSFRYAKNVSKSKSYKNQLFDKHFSFFLNKKIRNMLDVGCGNGDFLNNFLKNKKIKKFGIEPSQAAINLSKKRHKNINFKKAFSHNLPFPDNKFDLVNIWSVLHWIDRNHYLQSLGELIRVTNKYLMVMDFFPKTEHRTKYKYKKGFFTFKSDFDKILNSSGYLKKIFELNYFIDEKTKKLKITNNIKDNIFQRKMVIYEKKMILPIFQYKI